MKKLALLLVLVCFANTAFADNLFKSTNPFPQTSPETMNNLYEAELGSMGNNCSRRDRDQAKSYKTNKVYKNQEEEKLYNTDSEEEENTNESGFHAFK